MTDWRKDVKQDSRFLYYFDIEGFTPLSLTIGGYESAEAFCPDKKAKGILWCLKFKGSKSGKMLGVNVTNGNLIEHLHGSDKEGWIGKEITLRVAECKGKKCIRVDAPGAKLPSQCPQFTYVDGGSGNARAAKPEPEPTLPEEPDMGAPTDTTELPM